MSIAKVNQNFKVVTESVEAISLLNGNVKIDTKADGAIDIQQFGDTRIQVDNVGNLALYAADGKNINLATTNGGKTIISDLDYVDKDGIVIENVQVGHDMGSANVTKLLPDSGSYTITVDGIPTVDETGTITSSDAGGIFLATKKASANSGVINVLSSVEGDKSENIEVTWVDDVITIMLSGGNVNDYAEVSSTFKVKIV